MNTNAYLFMSLQMMKVLFFYLQTAYVLFICHVLGRLYIPCGYKWYNGHFCGVVDIIGNVSPSPQT